MTSTLPTPTENGNAIVELAFVIPLLVGLIFGGIEFSRSLKYSQAAVTFSREAASLALRRCAGYLDSEEALNCLNLRRVTIEDFANTMFPGTEIALSLYRYEGPINGGGTFIRINISDERNHLSKFGIGGQSGQGRLEGTSLTGPIRPEVLYQNRVIVIGEAFVPYPSLVGMFPSIYSYSPGIFYEVSVM